MRTWGRGLLAIAVAVALPGMADGAAESPDGGTQKTAPAAGAPGEPSRDAAEPAVAPDAETVRPLRVQLSIYTWLTSLSSTVRVRDRESTSKSDLGDVLKALDFANFAHLEVQKGRWGVFSELDFTKLSGDTEFHSPRTRLPIATEADGAIKQTMVELGAIRSFEGSRLSLDALAGARYFRAASDVHAGRYRSHNTTDWVDPLAGARLRLRLSGKCNASLRGDLAGFGAGSELSTNIVGTVSYDLSRCYVLGFGYRYLDIDYNRNAVHLSSTTQGPVIGISVRF